MARTASTLALALFAAGNAQAVDSVFIGRALSNEETGLMPECPPDHVCLNTWSKWEIKVSQTLAGPPLSGVVKAAKLQHGRIVPSYLRRFRFFVLRPIENAVLREQLQTEYLLVEVAQPIQMYCINNHPTHIGLEQEQISVVALYANQTYCFSLADEDQ